MSFIPKSEIPKNYIPSHLTVGSKVVIRNIDDYDHPVCGKDVYTIENIEYIDNAPISLRRYERTKDIYLYTLKDYNGKILEQQYTQPFLSSVPPESYVEMVARVSNNIPIIIKILIFPMVVLQRLFHYMVRRL